MAERKAMIDRDHRLPVSRQTKALGISRGSVYYLPKPTSPADLTLLRRIDELHLEHPFAGARMLRDLLRQEVVRVWRTPISLEISLFGGNSQGNTAFPSRIQLGPAW